MQKDTKIFSIVAIFTMFSVGMLLVPLANMHLNLEFIPGDLGDGRLNNYFLEHGYKWLTGQVKSFWDAPFFYPAPQVMTLSDNHLGTFLFYSFFRFLNFDRETSYQLWFLVIFSLNYLSAAWTLKKFQCDTLGIAIGAYIFTFSLPVAAQLGHSQLLPRFMIPLAIYFAIDFLDSLDIKSFFAMCLSVVLQFYCTIYMGYFLSLGLIMMLLAYMILHNDRAVVYRIVWHSPRAFLQKLLIAAFSILIMLPLMYPYYQRSKISPGNSWETISSLLPRVQSYLYPASGSWSWGWLQSIGETLPIPWEHQIFIGLLPCVALILMPFLAKTHRNDPLVEKGLLVSVTLVLLALCTLYWQGLSLYGIIYELPGVNAIRGVARIMLMECFFFAFLLSVAVSILFKGLKSKSASHKLVISAILLLLTIIDQRVVYLSDNQHYSKSDAQKRSKYVENLVLKKSTNPRLFAYMSEKPGEPYYNINLDAMMASQNLHIPTVNGYSGSAPKNYPCFPESSSQYGGWSGWMNIYLKLYNHLEYNRLLKDMVVVGRDQG